MSLLEFRGVRKTYQDGPRELVVLRNVSFEVHAGEKVGLRCARHGGKTTLLKLAAGLLAPEDGEVFWEGQDLARMSGDDRARLRRCGGISLVQGHWRPGRSASVLQHVATPLYSSGASLAQAERGAREALRLTGASPYAHLRSGRLGMSERFAVELARAVSSEPRLLLVDEPPVLPVPADTSAVRVLIREVAERLGCALIVASEEVSAVSGLDLLMDLASGDLTCTSSESKIVEFPVPTPRRGQREAS